MDNHPQPHLPLTPEPSQNQTPPPPLGTPPDGSPGGPVEAGVDERQPVPMELEVGAVVSRAWELVKQNLGSLLVMYGVVFGLSILGNVLLMPFQEQPAMGLIVGLAFAAIQVIVGAGTVKYLLAINDGEKPGLEILVSTYTQFWDLLVGGLLYGLVVFVGFLLFLIPGIIFSLKYQFYQYLIVDQHLSAMEAISESSKITKGNLRSLFLLGLANMAIVFLGMLALGVGLILAVPVSLMTIPVAYRILVGKPSLNESGKDIAGYTGKNIGEAGLSGFSG